MKLEVETKTNPSFPFEGKVYLYRDSSEQLPIWIRETLTKLKPAAEEKDIFSEILTNFLSARGLLLEKGGNEHMYNNFLMIKETTDYAGWCVINHPLIAIASGLTLEEIDKMFEHSHSKKILSIEYPGKDFENFYTQLIESGFGDFRVLCYGNIEEQEGHEIIEKTTKGCALKELEDLPGFKESINNSQSRNQSIMANTERRYLLAIKKEGFEAIRYSDFLHTIETNEGNRLLNVCAYMCDPQIYEKERAWRLIERTITYSTTTRNLSEIHSKLEEITRA